MSHYYRSWAPYVSVARRRMQAESEIERRRKKGQAMAPVIIEGRTIATSFWGKAWCENLESYHDFDSRLPRGRSYVRNRAVLDLQIAPREVTALVSGSSIYNVNVSIASAPKARWLAICTDCAGGIDSLVELLQGRLSKSVMERLCRQDTGLFPKPSEIKFSCSCPDFADMCKHVAAVLYGVGARLDREPKLLFRLRAVDEKDLLANVDVAAALTTTAPGVSNILAAGDMSALFGIEMAETTPSARPQDSGPARPRLADSKSSPPKMSRPETSRPKTSRPKTSRHKTSRPKTSRPKSPRSGQPAANKTLLRMPARPGSAKQVTTPSKIKPKPSRKPN